MRIYEFDFGGAKDWVFAPNMKEAKKFYISFTDCGDLDGCKVKIVPKSKWEEMKIIDPDEREPDLMDDDYGKEGNFYNGYRIIETFKDYAERNTQTDMIASTEF